MAKHAVRMAKASDADIAQAIDLCSALDALRSGWDPSNIDESIDVDDPTACKRALSHLLTCCSQASLFRVVFGMSTLCNPRNRLIDPDSDVLDLHPELKAVRRG